MDLDYPNSLVVCGELPNLFSNNVNPHDNIFLSLLSQILNDEIIDMILKHNLIFFVQV